MYYIFIFPSITRWFVHIMYVPSIPTSMTGTGMRAFIHPCIIIITGIIIMGGLEKRPHNYVLLGPLIYWILLLLCDRSACANLMRTNGRTHRPSTSCSSVRKVFLLDILLAHWWVFLCFNFTFARLLLLLLLLWLCLSPINHVKCCNKSGGGGVLPQWGGGNAFFASSGCAGRQAERGVVGASRESTIIKMHF